MERRQERQEEHSPLLVTEAVAVGAVAAAMAAAVTAASAAEAEVMARCVG